MPAVPKKKRSRTHQHKAHSAWRAKFKPPKLVKCDHCGVEKLPHRVCAICGFYRGKAIIEPKTIVKKVKKT